ncbi:hypothetical protein GW17_00033783 [Ensete ventricosum]|nr:hypothetical protein GW17_00033783 [Ensete ventricosum]
MIWYTGYTTMTNADPNKHKRFYHLVSELPFLGSFAATIHHPHRFPLPSTPTLRSSTHCCNHLRCSIHPKKQKKKGNERRRRRRLPSSPPCSVAAQPQPTPNAVAAFLYFPLPQSTHSRNQPPAFFTAAAAATHRWSLPSSLPSHLCRSRCLLYLFFSPTAATSRSTLCSSSLQPQAAATARSPRRCHTATAKPSPAAVVAISPSAAYSPTRRRAPVSQPSAVAAAGPISPLPLLQPLLLPPLPLPPSHCPPVHSLDRQSLPSALSRRPPLPSTFPSLFTTAVPSLLAASIMNKKETHLRCSHNKKKEKNSTAAMLLFPFSLNAAAVVAAFIPTATYSSVVTAAFRYSAQPSLPTAPSAAVQPLPLQQPLL